MHIVFQQLLMPAVANGTILSYTVPATLSFGRFTDIYDFYVDDEADPPVARFVQFVFRGIPKDTQMTLGNINIFGIRLSDCPFFKGETPGSARRKLAERDAAARVKEVFPFLDSSKAFAPIFEIKSSPVKMPLKPLRLSTSRSALFGTSPPVSSPMSPVVPSPIPAGLTSSISSTVSTLGSLTTSLASHPRASFASGYSSQNDVYTTTEPFVGGQTLAKTSARFDSAVESSEEGSGKKLGSAAKALGQYHSIVQAQLSTNQKIQFVDALLLEESRLRLGISTKKRNTVLACLGYRIEFFNPNRFIYPRDERIIITASNLSGFCERKDCKTPNSPGVQQCRYCLKRHCPNCISQKEVRITEYCWTTTQTVCKSCAKVLARQEALIKEIASLREAQRKPRDDSEKISVCSFVSFPFLSLRS